MGEKEYDLPSLSHSLSYITLACIVFGLPLAKPSSPRVIDFFPDRAIFMPLIIFSTCPWSPFTIYFRDRVTRTEHNVHRMAF